MGKPVLQVDQATADTNRYPSLSIWADPRFDPVLFMADPSKGFALWDDFLTWGKTYAVASNVGRYASQAGCYVSYESTGCSLLQLTGNQYGVLRMLTDTSDSHEVNFTPGDGVLAAAFEYTSGTGPVLWYETRIRNNQIGTGQDFFFGLAAPAGQAQAAIIQNTDAYATNFSFIGFGSLTAAPTVINAVSQLTSSGVLTVGAVQTMVAATWYKLGMVLDPIAVDGLPVKFYVNGVLQQSLSVTTSAKFPTAVVLQPVFCFKNDASTGAAVSCDVDWWKAGALYA